MNQEFVFQNKTFPNEEEQKRMRENLVCGVANVFIVDRVAVSCRMMKRH
jgi:hypothetical protein